LLQRNNRQQQLQYNNIIIIIIIMTRYSHATTTTAAFGLLLVSSTRIPVSSATSVRRRNVVARQQQQQWTSNESLKVYDPDDSYDVEARIVGGEEASENEYPWFASSSGDVLCGASLIHPQFLLTAAHCYEAFLPGSTVYIGALQRGSGAETRTVEIAAPHPDFDLSNLSNDYMLLKLDAPVTSITPVELNTDDAVPANGDTVTSMGFGYTSEDGAASLTLRGVDLTTTSHFACTMSYLLVNRITESNMLCAGGAADDGDEDSCSGDSGGPLISATTGKQVGIVSYGLGCARPNTPGVYARVIGGMPFITAGICALATVDRPDSCPEVDELDDTTAPADTTPTVPIDADDTTTATNNGTEPTVPTFPAVTGDTAQVEFLVQYDGYASETTWELSLPNGNVVYTFPDDSQTPNNRGNYELWSYVFDDFPVGEDYTFTMRDFDGLQDGGFFIIYQSNVGNGADACNKEVLAVGDHSFFGSKSATFTVAPSSSSGLTTPSLTKSLHISTTASPTQLP
jgi:trypsin